MRRRDFVIGSGALIASPAFARTGLSEITKAYEQETGGKIGVFAQNIATGRVLGWRENERFLMCSSFKASLVASVLLQCDQGMERLDGKVTFSAPEIGDMYAPVARIALKKNALGKGVLSVEEMCRGAMEQSDNLCANLLLSRTGGPAGLTTFWRDIGDNVTRLDAYEPLLNRTPPGGIENTTTPLAMSQTLHKIVLGNILSSSSRKMFTDWMTGCRTGLNRLRAGVPAGWKVADKTGNNGHDAAIDLAVIWPPSGGPLLVSAYTRGGTPTQNQLTAVFRKIAQTAARDLTS